MKQTIVQAGSVTEGPILSPRLLHEFFERQVALRPSHPAVECRDEVVTYSQLNDQAEQIAALLRSKGVGQGSLVALYMRKSCRLFAALLGVLKAGAGYVPLDTQFPLGRIEAILEDAAIDVVLSEESVGSLLAARSKSSVICLDAEKSYDSVPPLAPLAIRPVDICYVIYTSGSTGKPKGVIIEHRNAVNFVEALHKVYKVDRDDRIYQGFSIAFDASVEEIWAAFSHGGTLVVPPEDIARSTLDAADFIRSRGITYFSTVPSFLALMKPELSELKVLILGGEICPPDLVNRWARPGLQMLNTYGPTESTVVATASECVAGEPVTIGTALPGYVTYVLDDKMTPVSAGEIGELYIGGGSIARGYMNLPQLTAERFVHSPWAFVHSPGADEGGGRLYRTYDLVRPMANGQLEFIGRADSQVKVRGFRIELSEIEAVLMEHPSISLAAANVVELQGLREIAAYVVLENETQKLDLAELGNHLRGRIPAYMVPRYLDIVRQLPTMVSGKTDRKALPPPRTLFVELNRSVVPPQTEAEIVLAATWERFLHITPLSVEDNFFLDLHGHSLIAAKIVTELRSALGTTQISVRDFYAFPTVRSLATHLEGVGVQFAGGTREDKSPMASDPSVSLASPLPRSRWLCVFLQFLGLVAFYGVVSAPVVCAIVLIMKVVAGELDWIYAANIATIVGFSLWPSWLLLSIVVKWTVIGRYKSGRYPVWGMYYFRWWLVSRFQAQSWSEMFVGTPLMSLYYRAMGAGVGRNCVIGTPLCTAFDLVDLGSDTSIGADTHVLGYRVEDGWLILGNVSIGRACFVGTHCSLGLNVTMQDGSRLDDVSVLVDGSAIGQGNGKRGSPAEDATVDVPVGRTKGRWHGATFVFGLVHLALIYLMGYILILSALPGIGLIAYALYAGGPWWGAAVAFATVPISILWYLQVVVSVKRILVGRIRPGTYDVHSLAYLRCWFLAYLMNNTRNIVLPLYATLFLPKFLRQLGAKIGRMVEISTIMHVVPDLLEIDDGSFLADACIVGGHRIDGGVIEIKSNKIGKRTFVGNSAYVPAGVDLGGFGLVGVMSTPPKGVACTADGTRWLGSPGFELPATQQDSCFSANQTFEPGYVVIGLRGLVDLLRIVLPGLLMMGSMVLFCVAIAKLCFAVPLWQIFVLASIIAIGLSWASLVCVAGVKTLLMGEFVPTVKPLWSSYVWFNEVVNALYETVASAALRPLMGTPFISPFLRLMGCEIGRWVFLETTLFSEFDLVKIGDRAALKLGVTVQTHLFEDRVMKADKVKIGAGYSVGNMAVVLYGTEMGTGSVLGPLSVLMKGEGLPAGSRWQGIPSQPIIRAMNPVRRRGQVLSARQTLQPNRPGRTVLRTARL